MTHPVIELRRVTKTYCSGPDPVHALRDVSLRIERGDFLAIMGSSGSGKSTLMNIVGCLDRPTQGQCLIDGIDVASLSPDDRADLRNQKIGFVFQGFNLLPRTSALENVELPLLYTKGPAREIASRSREALTLVGLVGREDHYPNQLSGGQQQRVAIARALVNRPSLVLADEPTGNLDTRTSIEIMSLFQALNRDHDITLVLVTHENDIAQYAKRIVVVRDGQVIRDRAVEGRRNAAEDLISAALGEEQQEEVA